MYLMRGHAFIVSGFVGNNPEQPPSIFATHFFLGENLLMQIRNPGCRRSCQVPIPATGTYIGIIVPMWIVRLSIVYIYIDAVRVRGVSHFCLSKHDVVYFCFKLLSFGWVVIQISSWFETFKLAWVTYWPLSKNRSKRRLRILRRIALDWVLYIFCIDLAIHMPCVCPESFIQRNALM